MPSTAPLGAEYELYDFGDDPMNQVNLADRHPEIVERLATALRSRPAEAERVRPDSETTDSLSQEQLERLRSLGYV